MYGPLARVCVRFVYMFSRELLIYFKQNKKRKLIRRKTKKPKRTLNIEKQMKKFVKLLKSFSYAYYVTYYYNISCF